MSYHMSPKYYTCILGQNFFSFTQLQALQGMNLYSLLLITRSSEKGVGVVDAPEIRSPRTLTRSLVQPFGMSVNEMRVGFFFSSSPSRPAPPNSVDMAPSTVRCDSSRLCLCRTGLKCLFFVFFVFVSLLPPHIHLIASTVVLQSGKGEVPAAWACDGWTGVQSGENGSLSDRQ